MKKKTKQKRFPDFNLVTTPESKIITFGTNVWIRKDKRALIIVFPAGNTLMFAPLDDIAKEI